MAAAFLALAERAHGCGARGFRHGIKHTTSGQGCESKPIVLPEKRTPTIPQKKKKSCRSCAPPKQQLLGANRRIEEGTCNPTTRCTRACTPVLIPLLPAQLGDVLASLMPLQEQYTSSVWVLRAVPVEHFVPHETRESPRRRFLFSISSAVSWQQRQQKKNRLTFS